MRTRTENAARVVVTGAGTAGARLAARAPGVTVIGEEAPAPYSGVLPAGRPARCTATLARTRQADDALPAGTSLLHLLTNDGGF
ncbi:hypothetical protein [Streptomyces sp. IBSNAI001]|uniref:hypothetical protein n=1 Tax=Streptomyces sp. IBSNAI001 TaxID=3457499 RepID=UPI003FD41AF8